EQTVNLSAMPSEVRILPPPPSSRSGRRSGRNSSVARASAFQAEGRGFESRFPLHRSSGPENAAASCWSDRLLQDLAAAQGLVRRITEARRLGIARFWPPSCRFPEIFGRVRGSPLRAKVRSWEIFLPG